MAPPTNFGCLQDSQGKKSKRPGDSHPLHNVRNALVRANYVNVDQGVHSTMEYLDRFFGNLVLGQTNVLKNRKMQLKVGTVNNPIGTVNGTVKSTVFDLIKANNTITATEISEQLGISLRTVKRKIKELKDKNIIARVGSDKTGYWQICADIQKK